MYSPHPQESSRRILKATRKITPTITINPTITQMGPVVLPKIGDNAEIAERIVTISSYGGAGCTITRYQSRWVA
jgi:hypothetical protein